MKQKIFTFTFLLLTMLTLITCNQPTPDAGKSENVTIQLDNPGVLISTIEFKVKAATENQKNVEENFIPWINIAEPEKEMDKLIDANKIVLPYPNVILIINYPLNHPVQFELQTTEKGYTPAQLLQEISKRYHEIYEDKKQAPKSKKSPPDLSDLNLSTIDVYKNANGKIILLPVIGS